MATTPNPITAPELQGLRAQPADQSSLWSAVVGSISKAADEVKQVPGAISDLVADKLENAEAPTVADTVAHAPIPGADTLKKAASTQTGLAGKLAAAAVPSTLEDVASLASGGEGEVADAAEYAPELKGLRFEPVETPTSAPLSSEDYMFHATDKSRANAIRENGLKPRSWLAKSPDEATRSGVTPISGNRSDLRVFAVPKKEVVPMTPDAADIGAREAEKGRFVQSSAAHPRVIEVDASGRPIPVKKAPKGEKLDPEVAKIIANMPPNGGRPPVRSSALSPEAADIIANMPPNGRAPLNTARSIQQSQRSTLKDGMTLLTGSSENSKDIRAGEKALVASGKLKQEDIGRFRSRAMDLWEAQGRPGNAFEDFYANNLRQFGSIPAGK